MPTQDGRQKVRVRVLRSSRTWRWKVIAAIVLGVLLIALSATLVPRWLASLASEGGAGGSSEPPPEVGGHP